MNKKLFTLLLGIFAFFAAYAQTSVVKGTVIDKDGDPLTAVPRKLLTFGALTLKINIIEC
jgi:hypothetical protein